MTGRPILTAAEMRAAEAATIAGDVRVETLMERAGFAAAEAIWRFAGPVPALVLCGPGNNGGDGYVIARALRERGVKVRVAALTEPSSDAARAARADWGDAVSSLAEAEPAPLLIDALFGTGLGRPLDEAVAQRLCSLAEAARTKVAVDLPSGVAGDDGCLLSPVPDFDLTVTFQTLKPAHLLHPAAGKMGRIVVADIGVAAESRLREIARPRLSAPGPADHKYSRGYVTVLTGEMPGAGALTASAALRGGAGYVRMLGNSGAIPGLASAIVQGGAGALDDSRIGAVAIGPGLGKSEEAQARLEEALASGHALVLDADALTLISGRLDLLADLSQLPILTPHEGEFARLFDDRSGSKVDRARRAAAEARSVIVYKGADTIIAHPDGHAALSAGPSWLATAGTGDVLTGVIAAMRAWGLDAFEAACAGVWLHGRAAQLAGAGLIADDLLDHLSIAFAQCLPSA